MSVQIDVQNVWFHYTDEEGNRISGDVLKGVSLQIEKGSFTAILGHNGSGKSTLARLMNGILVPSEGTIIAEGMDTRDDDKIFDIRRHIGMVFQNPDNQIVSSIVEDDVAFGPENLGVEPREIRHRVDESLKAVNMFHNRKKAPHLLSGGQKQRVAIAGAIAMKPECIVFDEPTAMLDPKGRDEVMAIIESLNKEGITVVLITHFMEEAAAADRVIIMDDGEVKMDGTPAEVFMRPDELRAMNLTVPMTVELAHRLRKRGIDVPKEIITMEEMVEYLCQYK